MLELLEFEAEALGRPPSRRRRKSSSSEFVDSSRSKDLFVETQSAVWDQVVAANLPRDVIQTVRDNQQPWMIWENVFDKALEGGVPLGSLESTIRANLASFVKSFIELHPLTDDLVARRQVREVLSSLLDSAILGPSLESLSHPILEQSRSLEQAGRTDAALDLLYEHIDETLLAGEFDRVDGLLEAVDPAKESVSVLVTILTATLPARKRLAKRKGFFIAVERALRESGCLESGLLTGLE